jgi:hypothetical protein
LKLAGWTGLEPILGWPGINDLALKIYIWWFGGGSSKGSKLTAFSQTAILGEGGIMQVTPLEEID